MMSSTTMTSRPRKDDSSAPMTLTVAIRCGQASRVQQATVVANNSPTFACGVVVLIAFHTDEVKRVGSRAAWEILVVAAKST